MRGSYKLHARAAFTPQADIYADKSALILEWLILEGQFRKNFSLREVCLAAGVSLGLTQKVFQVLIAKGFLKVSGLRTSKKFSFSKATTLLSEWLKSYHLLNKKRSYIYASGLTSRKKIIEAIEKSKLSKDVALALHSAAENHGRSNTNLKGLELYLLNPQKRTAFEKLLHLEPQERGYDVLLIEPYYRSMLRAPGRPENFLWQGEAQAKLAAAPPLLTYLDLYHYPLRGREMAEYLQKTELKRFFNGQAKT